MNDKHLKAQRINSTMARKNWDWLVVLCYQTSCYLYAYVNIWEKWAVNHRG